MPTNSPELLATEWSPVFSARLLDWFGKHAREMPWRKSGNPYYIWISEIMLQQTQVKTVLERFYFPFLKAFPTLSDLAAAK